MLNRHPVLMLMMLAAIWGGSFLFIRIAAPDFGAWPLAALRVGIAACAITPWLIKPDYWRSLRQHAPWVALVGLLNTALPFACFNFAAQTLPASNLAILNATTPLWGAVVGRIWSAEPWRARRIGGLLLGFLGVVLLVRDPPAATLAAQAAPASQAPSLLPVLACLAAALMYAVAANLTRRKLSDVPALATTGGSMLCACAWLALPAAYSWPASAAPASSWWAVLMLGLFCTAAAYSLFFRLIEQAGPSYALSVTYVIPLFAALWGWLFLSEPVTLTAGLAGVVILSGTALGSSHSAPGAVRTTNRDSTPPV